MTLRIPATFKHSLLSAIAISCVSLSPFGAHDANAMSLKETLEAAYDFNPAIKAERENLQATDEGVAKAVSEFRPTVAIDYSRGRQSISFAGAPEVYTDKESRQITIDQPLFDGFGSVSRFKSARFQVMSGRERLSAVTQDILLRAVTAYMDVLRDKAVVELSRNNIGVLNKQLDASEDRFDVGEVTRTDVAQSKARVSRSVSEEAQSAGALASSIATFKRIVGVSPEVLDQQKMIPELPATLEQAIAIALENNPNLLATEYTKKALNKRVSADKAEVLPSVALQGYVRREEGAGVTGGNDYDNDVIAVNVRVPLYQSGAEYARVRESKQNYHRAKYNTIDASNEVIERVTRAWENLQSSIATIQANESAIDAATIALDGVKQEQQYGARTVLDVLDAEQELFSTRVNLVRAQRNKLVGAYALLAEMGQLTPQSLGLDVEVYRPKENYERVDFKPIGW
ncbi:MAG: TolC family outer membrane protein [Alphaproteobacteria bacterium]|nr:TolC family outer membrane protein [Alphaproteobacteria bacterium]